MITSRPLITIIRTRRLNTNRPRRPPTLIPRLHVLTPMNTNRRLRRHITITILIIRPIIHNTLMITSKRPPLLLSRRITLRIRRNIHNQRRSTNRRMLTRPITTTLSLRQMRRLTITRSIRRRLTTKVRPQHSPHRRHLMITRILRRLSQSRTIRTLLRLRPISITNRSTRIQRTTHTTLNLSILTLQTQIQSTNSTHIQMTLNRPRHRQTPTTTRLRSIRTINRFNALTMRHRRPLLNHVRTLNTNQMMTTQVLRTLTGTRPRRNQQRLMILHIHNINLSHSQTLTRFNRRHTRTLPNHSNINNIFLNRPLTTRTTSTRANRHIKSRTTLTRNSRIRHSNLQRPKGRLTSTTLMITMNLTPQTRQLHLSRESTNSPRRQNRRHNNTNRQRPPPQQTSQRHSPHRPSRPLRRMIQIPQMTPRTSLTSLTTIHKINHRTHRLTINSHLTNRHSSRSHSASHRPHHQNNLIINHSPNQRQRRSSRRNLRHRRKNPSTNTVTRHTTRINMTTILTIPTSTHHRITNRTRTPNRTRHHSHSPLPHQNHTNHNVRHNHRTSRHHPHRISPNNSTHPTLSHRRRHRTNRNTYHSSRSQVQNRTITHTTSSTDHRHQTELADTNITDT